MSVKDQAVKILQDRANNKRTIYYGELAILLGVSWPPNSRELANLLGEISSEEVKLGRPMLSALVIGKENGEPGVGFYDLASRLGFNVTNKTKFFLDELNKVHTFTY